MRHECTKFWWQAQLFIALLSLPLLAIAFQYQSIAQVVEHACYEVGVKLSLPHGWSPAKGSHRKGTCIFAKGKEAFFCLLVPEVEAQWTAHSLLSNLVKELKERNHGLDEVAPREIYPHENGFAIVATLRRPPEGEAQIFVWAAAIKMGKKLIAAVCTSTPNIADSARSEMLAILCSLREIDASKEIGIRLPLPEGEVVVSIQPKANEPHITKPMRAIQPTPIPHRHAFNLLEFRRIALNPIAIEPQHSAKGHKLPSPATYGEITPDESGICRLPWLGMQFRLPSGWKVILAQQVAPLNAPAGFCIVGESEGGFVPTLSVNFVPTVVGLALSKDAIEAAKQIAQTFLSPLNWRQREKWQELTSQDGKGVMGLFDIPSTTVTPKMHTLVACMLFPGRQYAVLFVGTCQCDGDGKLHEVYQRIIMNTHFEGGGK